ADERKVLVAVGFDRIDLAVQRSGTEVEIRAVDGDAAPAGRDDGLSGAEHEGVVTGRVAVGWSATHLRLAAIVVDAVVALGANDGVVTTIAAQGLVEAEDGVVRLDGIVSGEPDRQEARIEDARVDVTLAAEIDNVGHRVADRRKILVGSENVVVEPVLDVVLI